MQTSTDKTAKNESQLEDKTTKNKSQPKKEVKEHDPYDKELLAFFKEKWDLGEAEYARDRRRMRILDMTDRGARWEAVDAKFEPYQILTDTNKVAYVKSQLLASLYTTARSAEVRPTSEDDAEVCTDINLALDNFWSVANVGFKQFLAGERAALLNLGITQVGWDESFISGNIDKATNITKGQVVLENIDPMHYMRDPFAKEMQKGAWVCTFDRFHKSVILANKHYKEVFQNYLANHEDGSVEILPNYSVPKDSHQNKDYYNVINWWYRTPDGKINEAHTIDTDVILQLKEDLQPAMYPFAELYCNITTGLVGTSCPAQIFANDMAYNILQSITITGEYKNQHPPRFVSASSGLNIPAFTKHGSEAGRTFVVNGPADQAVHYHQFPQPSPNVPHLLQALGTDINSVSGVDDKYTGRDTGSIITTGGTEEMLNRVTMIDTPKIVNYENYTKDLTKLILSYMLQYSPKRKYLVRDGEKYSTVEVDFPNLPKDTVFNYAIEISPELPKNKQRVAAWANLMMEKQMQYRQEGADVDLITEEEWLRYQDVPFKEEQLERMGFQRKTNAQQQAVTTVMQYANLVEQGMSPEDAIMEVANTIEKLKAGKPLDEATLASTQPMGGVPMPNAVPEAMPQMG